MRAGTVFSDSKSLLKAKIGHFKNKYKISYASYFHGYVNLVYSC